MDLTRTLPARLTVAREAAGLTQRQLAERAGIAQLVSISRYERGQTAPSLEIAARLARALGVSLDWLATGQESEREAADRRSRWAVDELTRQGQEDGDYASSEPGEN